ncbi:hypothetical protein CGCSCA5_v002456 [Colletotrichum siamense]|nr:hypothetical protein CGCSCA5_v002456 [Colletotrichum siamense]
MAAACQKCKKDITDEGAECDRCDVKYCSKSCQNLHWKNHKKSCARTRTANPSEPPRYTTYGWAPPSSSTAWNPSRPTPSRGLEAPIVNAFTNLEKRTYLHNRPEKDVYEILIDCYRLRMEDDAKIVGIMEPDSIYASRSSDGKAGFRRFLETARRSVNGKLLPPWWNDEKQQECEAMAADAGGWSSLKTKLSKADVIQHYGDDHFPMQLRMIGKFVWGSAPGGQDGTQIRRMLASREETSAAGPGFVDVLPIDSTTGTGYSSAFN